MSAHTIFIREDYLSNTSKIVFMLSYGSAPLRVIFVLSCENATPPRNCAISGASTVSCVFVTSFFKTSMLNGVPFAPALAPSSKSFCILSAYFPLARHASNFCASSFTNSAIFGSSAGSSPLFAGVISKIRSRYDQNAALPPISAAHSVASASLRALE